MAAEQQTVAAWILKDVCTEAPGNTHIQVCLSAVPWGWDRGARALGAQASLARKLQASKLVHGGWLALSEAFYAFRRTPALGRKTRD